MALAVDMLAVAAVLVWPLRRRFYQHDRGNGLTEVILPRRPRSVRVGRGFWFFGVGAGLGLLFIGSREWLRFEYRRFLAVLVTWAAAQPADALRAVGQANPELALVAASYFVCLALSLRADPVRRVVVLLHGVLLLALVCAFDVTLAVIGVATGSSIGPGFAAEGVSIVVIGWLVFVRMVFVTFMLPKPTTLVKTRPPYRRDALMMAIAISGGFGVVAILLAFEARADLKTSTAPLLLSFFVGSSFFTFIAVTLYGLRLLGGRPPNPIDPPPPLNVIVAAYNEQEMLPSNLEAIDRAAATYRGPVHVIVCNDGSRDNTVAVAEAVMSRFVAATGEVVTRPNGGISRAYNTALAHTQAEFVVRIDADTVVHPEAFTYAVRWLRDPVVGQVSALYLPRTDLPESWFHRMRLLECLFGFGFARQGHAVVDGIVCAPGPFAAYRRNVALQLGGYTAGMNGEDLDFTNRVGRAGYRVLLDPKVIAYEDVPYSLKEFREQRNRWSRAGIHCFSRFAPFCSGVAGPRSWFMFPRLIATRFAGPLRLLVLVNAVELAIFRPAYRSTVVIVGVLYLLASLPVFFVATVLLFRYGFIRKLPWLLLWYPFLVLRRFVVLEGLLGLPTRPVEVPAPLTRLVRQFRLAVGGTRQGATLVPGGDTT